jgi:hypothetical protein
MVAMPHLDNREQPHPLIDIDDFDELQACAGGGCVTYTITIDLKFVLIEATVSVGTTC